MKVTLSLITATNAFKQIIGVGGVIFCCSFPAHAKTSKIVDSYISPSDLILTLTDPLLVEVKVSQLNDHNTLTNDQNVIQSSSVKSNPVNVNCGVDVIQNNLNNASISNRVFGECGLHYHY